MEVVEQMITNFNGKETKISKMSKREGKGLKLGDKKI